MRGELSSECGASCLGASFLWGEFSWGELSLGRVVRNPVFLHRKTLLRCISEVSTITNNKRDWAENLC